MNKKGQILAGMVVFVVFMFFAGIAFCILAPAFNSDMKFVKTTSNGEHTGTVTAVETDGMIWHRNIVYFKTDVSSSQEDVYCVETKELRDKLAQYARDKTEITITYDDYFLIGYGLCDGQSGLITGVVEK